MAVGGIIAILVIAAVLVVIATTASGNGSIELHISQSGSKVFFENREKTTTEVDDQIFSAKNLRFKSYSLLVAKDGFWPWMKSVNIEKNTAAVITSWSLPQVIDHEIISPSEKDYSEILSKINNSSAPDEQNRLESSEGDLAVWIDGNTIFAEWTGDPQKIPYYFCDKGECDAKITVLKSTSSINSVSFLKNFDSVLVFSNSEGVYAIEVNNDGTQNFQPIFRDTERTQFYTEDNSTFYILQGGSVIKLSL